MADLLPYSTEEDSEELANGSSYSLLNSGKMKQQGKTSSISGGSGSFSSQQMGPLSGQSQSQMLPQLKMQQRFPPNQVQMSQLQVGGVMPSVPPNLQTCQQQLMQQLGQLQMTKQMTKQQLLKQSSHNAQQLNDKLNQINQKINYINQQLVLLSRLASQQKDATKNQESASKPTTTSSPKFGRNTPPIRNKLDQKQPAGNIERSLSSNSVTSMSMGGGDKNIAFGVQNLTLSGLPPSTISQTSARSISRLQQIISGSSSSEDLEALACSEDILSNPSGAVFTPSTPSSLFPGQQCPSLGSPFSPPHSGSVFSHSEAVVDGETLKKFPPSSRATSTHYSSSVIPTPKSFDDIQEFKPGVLWQPKTQINEPPQMYSKQNSVPSATGMYDPPVMPSNAVQNSGRHHHITRSQSVGGGLYYGGGGGYSRPSGGSGRGNFLGSNKYGPPHQSWSQMDPPRPEYGASQEQKFHGKSALRTTSYSGPPTASQLTPTSPYNQPFGMKPHQGNWKQPKQNRRMIPPSSLTPKFDYQYKANFHRAAGTPIGSQSGYLTPSTPGSQSDLGTQSWGAYASTSMNTSPMISNTVWGPNAGSKSQDDSKNHQWERSSNQIWNKPSSSLIEPVSLPNAVPSYTSSPSQPNMTLAEQDSSNSMTPTSIDSFNSGSGPWGQDGFDSLPSGGMLSPEPTFAEWQAGKKAHLSVFKLPTSPPSSPWIIIKNVTPQVCIYASVFFLYYC